MKDARSIADVVSGDRNNIYFIAALLSVGFPLRYNKLRGIRP
jgi:hypothetical protein